ncbi:hypothetical protein BKA62DRAFT_277485 [Auriculariales sp. MPI-PUGE-AT-0066]|nr:hypothetical protein BKA62DRAFT_277485 [Auriculariales sp. MPI-PUGE-AT-0066]
MDSAHPLPPELIIAIFERVARQSLYVDRSWVVDTAAISRLAYLAVRPILYETLVITNTNINLFEDEEEIYDRVVPFVRRMVVCTTNDIGLFNGDDTPLGLRRLLSTWNPSPSGFLEAPWGLAHAVLWRLAMLSKPPILTIDVKFERLSIAASQVPPPLADRITRISGYLPHTWDSGQNSLSDSPADWARSLLVALPNLTHLGLLLIRYDGQRVGSDQEIRYFGGLEQVVSTILDSKPRLQLCVRIGGYHTFGEEVLYTHVSTFATNPRCTVWFDPRDISSWQREEALAIADAKLGRDIWSSPPLLNSDKG